MNGKTHIDIEYVDVGEIKANIRNRWIQLFARTSDPTASPLLCCEGRKQRKKMQESGMAYFTSFSVQNKKKKRDGIWQRKRFWYFIEIFTFTTATYWIDHRKKKVFFFFSLLKIWILVGYLYGWLTDIYTCESFVIWPVISFQNWTIFNHKFEEKEKAKRGKKNEKCFYFFLIQFFNRNFFPHKKVYNFSTFLFSPLLNKHK